MVHMDVSCYGRERIVEFERDHAYFSEADESHFIEKIINVLVDQVYDGKLRTGFP